jgi:two-component system, chemotaxis family, chemotaxis protein CheY
MILDGFGIDGIKSVESHDHAPTRQVAFILVTGRGDKALIEQGKKSGINNYLPKPFTPQGLKAAIEAVVGKLI